MVAQVGWWPFGLAVLIAVAFGAALLIWWWREKPRHVDLKARLAGHVLVTVIGVFLVAYPIALVHAIYQVWPAVEEAAELGEADTTTMDAPTTDGSTATTSAAQAPALTQLETEVELFGADLELSPGQAYLLLIIVFGIAGAYLHTATSFATYVGMGKFKASWGWWYALRPFIGAGVALVLVVAILGGLVTLTSDSDAIDPVNLNPYTIAAFAALAGWFSKVAADKLEEIFETALANAKDRARSDKLHEGGPEIETMNLVMAADGTATLAIIGRNFTEDSTLLINGQETPGAVDATGATITAQLDAPPADGAEIVVVSPVDVKSDPAKLKIAAAPTISELDPATVDSGATDVTVTITGTGFASDPTVTVGGNEVTPDAATATDTLLEVTVAGPVNAASEVVVTNPDGQSATAELAIAAPAAVAAPTISELTPQDVAAGATAVALTITGAGFAAGATVTVAGDELAVTAATATTLTVTIPGPIGEPHDVVVTNPDGQFASTTLGVS